MSSPTLILDAIQRAYRIIQPGVRPLSLVVFLAVYAGYPKDTYAAESKFSPERWRQSVDAKNPNWSREALLKPLVEQYKLDGLDRAKVVSLLGEPGLSQEHEPRGQYRSRRDFYCLSAKDERSFSINYDGKDKVKSYAVESTGCKSCTLFIGAAKEASKYLQPAVLNKSLLQKYSDEQIRQMKISQVESILGRADKSRTLDRRAGGRIWVNVDYTWRLSADGTRVFVVNGRSVPKRDWKPNEIPEVSSWWLITMAQGCHEVIPQDSETRDLELELELRRLEEKLRKNAQP